MTINCPNCTASLERRGMFNICHQCRIAIPDSLETLQKGIDEILALRQNRRERLYKIENKYNSSSAKMTAEEKEERELWCEFNALEVDIKFFNERCGTSNDALLENVYPKLYPSIELFDKIKKICI